MTSPEVSKTLTFHWQGPGKTAYLDISPGTGHGIEGPTLNDGGQPISWPDGDMMRHLPSAQADLSYNFSVNNDGNADGSFGHFFRSASKEAKVRFGPPGAMSGQSGQPMYSSDVAVESCNMTNDPRGRSIFEVVARIDTWVEGTWP